MATLRCEECGAKLYEDDDECPKCGAAVDDRPRAKKRDDDEPWEPEDDRSRKKVRRDDDDDDDRPKAKSRRDDDDDDDDDDRPRKASRDRDDDDDDRPKKKTRRDDDDDDDPRTAKKRGTGDFEVVDDDDEEAPPKKKPAPPLPTKAAPPLPPSKPALLEVKKPVPPPPSKPTLSEGRKPAPSEPAKAAPLPAKKPPSADFEIEYDDGEETPKARTKTVPNDEARPAVKKSTALDDNAKPVRDRNVEVDAPRPTRKARRDDGEPLKVPRWSGLFLWTVLLGLIGPILLGVGYFLANQSKVTKTQSYQYESPRVKATGSFTYNERDDVKAYAGVALAAVGGTAVCLAYLLFYLWLWRAWRLVPKEYGGMNPLVVLLLLMTPVVNLFGIFLAIPGLSKALRRILEDLEPQQPAKTGVGLGMTACIFLFIPGLNLLSGFLFLAWFDQANYAKNRIIALQEAAA